MQIRFDASSIEDLDRIVEHIRNLNKTGKGAMVAHITWESLPKPREEDD